MGVVESQRVVDHVFRLSAFDIVSGGSFIQAAYPCTLWQ
jgi:hypothetical protein